MVDESVRVMRSFDGSSERMMVVDDDEKNY